MQYKLLGLSKSLISGKKYRVVFDLKSTIDKAVLVKINNEGVGFLTDSTGGTPVYSLTADETRQIDETFTCGDWAADGDFLLLGLGQNNSKGEAANLKGDVTISDLHFYEVDADGTETGVVQPAAPTPVPKGTEYQFTDEYRAADFADPGLEKEGYTVVFDDEFDGNYGSANVDANGLNLDSWSYELGDGSIHSNPGWGNSELESYTNSAKNVGVNEDLDNDGKADGLLRITASYEKDGVSYGNEAKKYYSSARLRTTTGDKALFNMTYGYVEARIALPETVGAWPAFWMLPESTDIYGNWPTSGEIDIMETTGTKTDEACGTLHWGTPVHVYEGSGFQTVGTSDLSHFHTYAVDWEPGKISWIYDGRTIYTISDWTDALTGSDTSLAFDAPFDQPFYMLLNLAVDSGNFGGAANKAAFKDDINMYVDYVRAYQKTTGYAENATKTASEDVAADWADYAGKNQIAEMTGTNLISPMGEDKDADLTDWYLAVQDDAKDSQIENAVIDGQNFAKLMIASAGSQDYSTQLLGHYDAKKGYTYQVSFDAKAEGGMVGKNVNADSKEWQSWSTFGSTPVKLSDKLTHYSFVFNQKKDFEKCRIEFNLGGQGTGTVYIGNVKVNIVDPATVAEKERTADASGDVIFNGDFTEGNGRTGYWNAKSGTTLSVPRYTTTDMTGSDLSVIDVAATKNYEKNNVIGGKKYYERRAELSGTNPTIWQVLPDLSSGEYDLSLDVYGKQTGSVKAAVYTTNEAGTALDTLVKNLTLSYEQAGKVESLKAVFEIPATKKAALVLSFDQNVSIDNVKLISSAMKPVYDKAPIDRDTSFATNNNGSGTASEITKTDGIWKATDITSDGGEWYTTQFISDHFHMQGGETYTLRFDYRLSGKSNNTFKYILQEDGGSWHVFNGSGPADLSYNKTDDNFVHYETTFKADMTMDTAHLVFGFGQSGADKATFEVANVRLYTADASAEEKADDALLPGSTAESGNGGISIPERLPILPGNDIIPSGSSTGPADDTAPASDETPAKPQDPVEAAIASNSTSTQNGTPVQMYRFYNPKTGEHLFTTSTAEAEAIRKAGWKQEGGVMGVWKTPKVSAHRIYRLYNPNNGFHHYSMTKAEIDMLVRAGWKNEGIAYYSDEKKGVPVYREYNPNNGQHNYTTSLKEHRRLASLGWKAEGIAWYGLK